MARNRWNISKWFSSAALVFCMANNGAGQKSNKTISTLSDFEQIKNDIISLREINEFEIERSPLNDVDQRCLSELHAIGNGIKNSELWAMKSNVDLFFFSNITQQLVSPRIQQETKFLLLLLLICLDFYFRIQLWTHGEKSPQEF